MVDWQATARSWMLKAEESNDASDEVIRAKEGVAVCASDEGSI